MTDTVTALLTAILLWWFSTGAILIAVRLADRAGPAGGRAVTVMGLPLIVIGGYGFLVSLNDVSTFGAYVGFLSALALWGWVELAFLTGTITGPMKQPCPPGRVGLERFVRAWGALAYHEIALAALLVFAVIFGWGSENAIGLWTLIILYFARVSAKLNLFLGVPHINTEFLPSHLSHLASHFRHAKMNALFPVSVTALTFALGCWLERLFMATTDAQTVGFALLAAITALALLEHWLLILSLPDAKLWRWMLPETRATKEPRLKGGEHEI